MLIQYVWWAAGDAVEQGTATARVAEVAAEAPMQGGYDCDWAPRPSSHCLLGAIEVLRRAVGEEEVAQDVGRIVAFCMGHMDMEVRLRRTALAHLPILGRTRTLPASGPCLTGHSPWHSPSVSRCTHALLVTWGPGGRTVISSAVP